MKKLVAFKNLSFEAKTMINLTLIQSIFYFAWAFPSYSGVYLQQNGFSASLMGNLNAVNSLVAIFAMMFLGMLSDKINSIKKVMIFVAIMAATLYFMIPFLPVGTEFSVLIFFIFYPLVNIFKATAPILVDNLTVRTSAMLNLNYGVMRSSGSFFFAIGCFVAIFFISIWNIESSFYGFMAFVAPSLVIMFFAFDPKNPHAENASQTGKKAKISFGPLLKNYYYITFLVAMAIVQFAVNAEFNFFSYFMESVGVSSDMFANILAVRALMEIPCLIFMFKLRKKFKLKNLIIVACALMGVECLLLGAWAGDLTQIMLCATVYGLGNGMFLGSLPMYLYKLAPDNLKASSQTIYSAVASIAGIGGNLAGGFMFDIVGGKLFFIILCVIFVTGSFVLFTTSKLKKDMINPADEKER